MRAAFRKFMVQKKWARPGTNLVIGVSGGVDSMVLLHLLCEWSEERSFSVVAAHLNHTLRGEESERDERFVRDVCQAWKIPVEVVREDVRTVAKQGKLPIQVAARKVRYEFFRKVMEKHGGTYLALGHHADDVAETVMMRWLRGASVQGLRGIPLQNGMIIRPLLPFTRREIISYANENGIAYVEDSSNQKLKYLRNRVRHDWIPIIEREYQPAFSRHLVRYAAYFEEIHSFLNEAYTEIKGEVTGKDGEIRLGAFRRLHIALQRVFLEAYLLGGGWIEDPLSFEQLNGILKIVAATGGTRRFELRKGLWVIREYDRLFVTENPGTLEISPVACQVPGSVALKEIGNRLIIEESPELPKNLHSNPQEVYVNGDRIGKNMWIRAFRPGDRIEINGMVKLKKIFINAKIPARRRPLIPLVGSGKDIVWVGGIRVDRRYYITNETRRFLHLRFQSPLEAR